MRRKREGRGSETKVQASLELGSGAARLGRRSPGRKTLHCRHHAVHGVDGARGRCCRKQKAPRSGEEEGRADGRHLNKPQPPSGQVDTHTSSPSADRSRPASACLLARQDEGGRPPSIQGGRAHSWVSADVRVSGRGSRRGQGHVLVEGSPEWQAGLCSGPRGARQRHPPSIAAGLKGKHEDRFGNGFCQFGTRERKGIGDRLGGGADGTGKRCENGWRIGGAG